MIVVQDWLNKDYLCLINCKTMSNKCFFRGKISEEKFRETAE